MNTTINLYIFQCIMMGGEERGGEILSISYFIALPFLVPFRCSLINSR